MELNGMERKQEDRRLSQLQSPVVKAPYAEEKEDSYTNNMICSKGLMLCLIAGRRPEPSNSWKLTGEKAFIYQGNFLQ